MISWLYYLGHWGVSLFLFLFTRFKIKGKQNMPKSGGVLVCANHLGTMDPPVVGVSLGRITIFMAKEELFRSRFSGYFVSRFGAFPVQRGRLDRQALRQAEKVLSEKKVLVMFPEGTRSSGQLQSGFMGAALIAERAGVPIVPIGLIGTERIKGWKWMLHRPKIIVNIGPPFHLSLATDKARRAGLAENTSVIMEHIAKLLPDEYRGRYRE
jgi:1-acyl-sn-glycerol-3-phosphate acyltransferase